MILNSSTSTSKRDLLHARGIATDTRFQNERLQDLASDSLVQLRYAESTNSRAAGQDRGYESAKTELEGQLNGALKTNTKLPRMPPPSAVYP